MTETNTEKKPEAVKDVETKPAKEDSVKTDEKVVVSKAGKGKSKKKKIRQISHGRAYIQATYNNTIVSLTDLNGNVIAFSSAGQNGFKGPKKSTPYAAGVIVENAVQKAKVYGLKDVNVFVKGIGSGRDSAIRALNANGINILSIKDVTPIPHNGVTRRKPRRI